VSTCRCRLAPLWILCGRAGSWQRGMGTAGVSLEVLPSEHAFLKQSADKGHDKRSAIERRNARTSARVAPRVAPRLWRDWTLHVCRGTTLRAERWTRRCAVRLPRPGRPEVGGEGEHHLSLRWCPMKRSGARRRHTSRRWRWLAGVSAVCGRTESIDPVFDQRGDGGFLATAA